MTRPAAFESFGRPRAVLLNPNVTLMSESVRQREATAHRFAVVMLNGSGTVGTGSPYNRRGHSHIWFMHLTSRVKRALANSRLLANGCAGAAVLRFIGLKLMTEIVLMVRRSHEVLRDLQSHLLAPCDRVTEDRWKKNKNLNASALSLIRTYTSLSVQVMSLYTPELHKRDGCINLTVQMECTGMKDIHGETRARVGL